MKKVLAFLTTILAVASSASNKFVIQGRTTNRHVSTSSSLNKAISFRGGDVLGLPITQENLVTALVGWYGFNAVLGIPAPAQQAKLLNQKVEPGTFDSWLIEEGSATAAGVAIVSYLATFSNMDIPTAVAYAGLPCTYLTYKCSLDGTYVNLGFPAAKSNIVSALFVLCSLLLFSGRGNPSLIATFFVITPFLNGIIGYFNPNSACSAYGRPLPDSDVTRVFWKWMSFQHYSLGLIALILLYGGDWKQAVGYVGVSIALFIADVLFISKDADTLDMAKIPIYFTGALGVLVGAGLLLGGSSSTPTPVTA